MEKITAIRGFKDILPEDARRFWEVESIARQVFNSFGFREIRVPIMEKTELFKRSIGETTDIVEKEMYTFADRDNEFINFAAGSYRFSHPRLYRTQYVRRRTNNQAFYDWSDVPPRKAAERTFPSV